MTEKSNNTYRDTDAKKELKDISPYLSQIEISNPFRPPEGYFDAFAQNVQSRIEKNKKPEKSLTEWFTLPRLALVTASLTLLIAAGYFFMAEKTDPAVNGFADEIFFDQYFEWYTDYRNHELLDIISDEQSDSHIGQWLSISMIDDEALMDYLLYYEHYFSQELSILFPID